MKYILFFSLFWEEVASHGGTPNPKFANSNVLSYCWNTLPEWRGDELPYKLANAGYPNKGAAVQMNYAKNNI